MPKLNSPVYGESLKNVVFVVFHAMIFSEESEKFWKFYFFVCVCPWGFVESYKDRRAQKYATDITPWAAKNWP